MRQLVPVLVISLACAVPLASGQMAYDEPLAHTEAFRKALQTEDYEAAFMILEPSENSANSHPIDLFFLATMYSDQGIPNLGTKRERAVKSRELNVRAALTGYEPAVIGLINAFLWDDEIPGYKSDKAVADCLDGAIDKRAYVSPDKDWLDPKLVKDCLLLADSPPIGMRSESGTSQ